jgi:hypothetical protein
MAQASVSKLTSEKKVETKKINPTASLVSHNFFTVTSIFFIIAGVHSQESVNLKDKMQGGNGGISILPPILISCGLKTKRDMKEQNMVPCVSTANSTEVTYDKANCAACHKHLHVSPSYLHGPFS